MKNLDYFLYNKKNTAIVKENKEEEEELFVMWRCKNCDREIPSPLSFCSEACKEEYKQFIKENYLLKKKFRKNIHRFRYGGKYKGRGKTKP